ncbi:MAG TPA: hypothetical protein VJG13_15925 [Thermoanaerobaculia bacterium]|nr:hypothetical protein [Thermoanaerobaculia bacterium]
MRSDPARLTAPLAAAVAFAAGCASLDLPLPERSPDGTARAVPVAITVDELPGEDVWHVRYALGAPAAAVEFPSAGTAFRRERWAVGARTAEPEWRLDGPTERICFSRPVRSFALSFRTWTDPQAEDPALHLALGDGGRLLYTGHLLVRPLASCAGEAAPAGAVDHWFTFRAAPGRTIRVLDQTATGELRWQPPAPALARTYAVFGAPDPVATEAATVIVDPTLPGWMKEDAAAFVPGLVERFAAATATPLPFRPLLVAAWGGEGGAASSVSGRALPGLALVSAEGPAWREGTPAARRQWFDGLAREVFQLWGAAASGSGGRPGEASEWLTEAAADHFAAEAAVAFGLESAAEPRRRLVERANDCLVRLEGRSLAAAAADPEDRPTRASCGAVALAVADGALRRGRPPSELAVLFRRLFEHAAATGGYGTPAFFGGLQELGAEPGAATDLRRLIRGAVPEATDRFLQRLLEHAGVATELVAPGEAAADPETLREAVGRAVGRCYCGVGETASCDPAATGRLVSAVAGGAVADDPPAAWARLRAAVARGGSLDVELEGEEVTLFCPAETFDPTWESLLAPAEPEPSGAGASAPGRAGGSRAARP